MTHGENIPVQIAEYARLSNVTKIVIGQSNARRNHFFSKATLTERLIEIVPDIDIHIIPDALKTRTHQKRSFARYVEKTVSERLFPHGNYICSMYLDWSSVSETEFHGYKYCNDIYSGNFAYFDCDRWLSLQCGGSVLSVFLFCFFLTEPRMSFQTYAVGLSGNIFHNAYFIRAYGSTCSKAENTCKTVCSACFSYTSFCSIRIACCKRQKEGQRFLILPVHSFFAY